MILYQKKEQCFGCGACFQKCPKSAIKMIPDEKGFNYPVIDEKLCINCGLCKTVCPIDSNKFSNKIMKTIALQHNNSDVLKKSSSGGAFIAISDYILANNGYVYGSKLNKSDFSVEHFCADNSNDRDLMCGSKYVQSNTSNIFNDIKEKLDNQKLVLFTGTPCQNAALVNFLNGKPENLILVDLLCHGAPSNKILKDHIKYWENKTKKKIVDFKYRTKHYAYAYAYACGIKFENRKEIFPIEAKRIIKLYTYNMRPSCYKCPFASKNRIGDITIGDLWNPHKYTDIRNAKGVSLIFINTEKGNELINKINKNCHIEDMSIDLFRDLSALNKPVKYEEKYDNFWKDYQKHGYKYVLDKYAHQSVVSTCYNLLWRLLYHLRLHKLALKLGLI